MYLVPKLYSISLVYISIVLFLSDPELQGFQSPSQFLFTVSNLGIGFPMLTLGEILLYIVPVIQNPLCTFLCISIMLHGLGIIGGSSQWLKILAGVWAGDLPGTVRALPTMRFDCVNLINSMPCNLIRPLKKRPFPEQEWESVCLQVLVWNCWITNSRSFTDWGWCLTQC